MRKIYLAAALAVCLNISSTATGPAPVNASTRDLKSENLEVAADGKDYMLCSDGAFDHHGGDMAFWGDKAYVLCGNDDGDEANDGFVIADISDPGDPRELGRFACAASASDIAVWGDLVFLPVDRNSESTTAHEGPYDADQDGTYECDDENLSYGHPDPTKNKDYIFRGIRIVSVADPSTPTLLKNVQMKEATGVDAPGGIHTVTAVPGPAAPGEEPTEVYVYGSGLATGSSVKNFVMTVPIAHPKDVSVDVIDLPKAVEGCHDMAFLASKGLGICNGIGKGSILWDVADDPTRPRVLGHIKTPNPSVRHHSSAFSWDGDTLVISDENLSTIPTMSCREDEEGSSNLQKLEGGLWFYDLSAVDLDSTAAVDALEPVGYQPPHPVVGNGWCTSVNFNVVPTRDADVLVAAWYGGGMTVVDFSDPQDPDEIAHFIASPGDTRHQSFTRAAYWYNGKIYINNVHGCVNGPICLGPTERGLDILELTDPRVDNHIRLPHFDMGRQLPLPPSTEVTLTYDGARSAYVGEQFDLAASLSSVDGPVVGARVIFRFDRQTHSATTDEHGRAVITHRAAVRPGVYDVNVSFEGAEGLDAAVASAQISITPRN